MTKIKSRIITILILALLILAALFVLLRVFKPAVLNNPESIVYDASADRFLISNAGSGQILSLDAKGKYSLFLKGLDNPRGLALKDDFLYAADNAQIRVIDLKKAELAASIPVAGSIMLNDLAFDHLGYLYATDTRANKLYIVDPASKQAQGLESDLLAAPNGIVYDYPRRQMFIVCLTKGSPILAFNLQTQQFSVFKSTLYDNLDGITIDDLGRIYFSSWTEEAIFQIPQEQNRTLIWQSDISSPADIYYHQPTNEILVPDFKGNAIKRFPAQ